ncbi:hypothetical protein [Actinoallomurus sp. CA-150999]|uniref:hypothetical protein n=1 Tax=Actinoallomurus sp. CA-150999 TaxID=3239887 RepID=UPI003D8C9011
MNALDGAAALVTICSFLLALWQFLEARHTRQTERERIAQQSERIRNAVAAAIGGAEAADLIVQRAKQEGATVTELQNIARTMRMHMGLLARQLEQEHSLLEAWQQGKLSSSSSPRAVRKDHDQQPAATTPDPS